MLWYHAVILGLIEGITEFLPVSSTGHLIIAAGMMGLTDGESKGAIDTFSVVVQGASLFAIVGLYWPRIRQMVMGLFGRDESGRQLLNHLLIAFIPMLVLGPLLHDYIEATLFHHTPVLISLALGGVWMIHIDHRRKHQGDDAPTMDIEDMTWKHALGIGLFQCVSLWPGTSRAMMTMAGGTVLGLKPAKAAEFSFLLGLPTIAGASVYVLYKDLWVNRNDAEAVNMFEQLGVMPILLGCAVTVVAAAVAIKWLVHFLNRHGLAAFGWYRIAMAIVLGSLLSAGWVTMG